MAVAGPDEDASAHQPTAETPETDWTRGALVVVGIFRPRTKHITHMWPCILMVVAWRRWVWICTEVTELDCTQTAFANSYA